MIEDAEWDFEFSPEDLALINHQERLLLYNTQGLDAKNAIDHKSWANQPHRTDLQILKDNEAKSGEIMILRQKIIELENERLDMLRNHRERLDAIEHERQAIAQNSQKELEQLRNELSFQKNLVALSRVERAVATSLKQHHKPTSFYESKSVTPTQHFSCEVNFAENSMQTFDRKLIGRGQNSNFQSLYIAIRSLERILAIKVIAQSQFYVLVTELEEAATLGILDKAIKSNYEKAIESDSTTLLLFLVSILEALLINEQPGKLSLDWEPTSFQGHQELSNLMCNYLMSQRRNSLSLWWRHIRHFKFLLKRRFDLQSLNLWSLIVDGQLANILHHFLLFYAKKEIKEEKYFLLGVLETLGLLCNNVAHIQILISRFNEHSIINLLNETLCLLIRTNGARCELSQDIVWLILILLLYSSKGSIPYSIAFGPTTLRMIIRRTASRFLFNGSGHLYSMEELMTVLHVSKAIIIYEETSMLEILSREAIVLLFLFEAIIKSMSASTTMRECYNEFQDLHKVLKKKLGLDEIS